MTKRQLLILGVGPLPFDKSNHLFAPGLRTWQFATVLAAQKHSVTVVVVRFGLNKNAPEQLTDETVDGIRLIRMPYDPDALMVHLKKLHADVTFDAIVSTTDVMNAIAARVDLRLPRWLDYNGDVFAEKQLMGKVYGNDDTLKDQWELFLAGLEAADRLSTCSRHQTWAMLGQLGLAGRLGQYTTDETLVHTIVPCSQVMASFSVKDDVPCMRDIALPSDAYVVFWQGGYNVWTDPDVLFEGLRRAIEKDDTIHYLSTGGALDNHDTATFNRFEQLIDQSTLKDHFHFTGWIPTEDVSTVAHHAHLALNLDTPAVEAELGYRNRIIDWILYRLPIATTTLSDITQTLAQKQLVYPIAAADPASLADAILMAKAQWEHAKDMTDKAAEWLNTELRESDVFKPLIDWAAAPVFAKDHCAPNAYHPPLAHLLYSQQPEPQASYARRLFRRVKRLLRR